MKTIKSFESIEDIYGYITVYGFLDGFKILTALDGGQKAILGDNGIQLVTVIEGNPAKFFGPPVVCQIAHERYDEAFLFSSLDRDPLAPSGFVYAPKLISIASSLTIGRTSDFELRRDGTTARLYTLAEALELRLNPNITIVSRS